MPQPKRCLACNMSMCQLCGHCHQTRCKARSQTCGGHPLHYSDTPVKTAGKTDRKDVQG